MMACLRRRADVKAWAAAGCLFTPAPEASADPGHGGFGSLAGRACQGEAEQVLIIKTPLSVAEEGL
jgi:hypothetical protein